MVVNQWFRRQIQALLVRTGGMFVGMGGAVTQITSRTTAVALNKLSGSITFNTKSGTTTEQPVLNFVVIKVAAS